MLPPYGCKDRKPFRETVRVLDGHYYLRMPSGEMSRADRVTEIPFVMAPDCQFTKTELGQRDERCTGCCHRLNPTETPTP